MLLNNSYEESVNQNHLRSTFNPLDRWATQVLMRTWRNRLKHRTM